MSAPHASRPPLSEETCRRMAALVMLDRVITEPRSYHPALLDGDDEFLGSLFDYMLGEDLVSVGDDDYYEATPKGNKAYQQMLQQQRSYLIHFDLYSAVDLSEGAFADEEHDLLDDPRWSDLRVAVAEFKAIEPYRMVFLSMLADGSFFENADWKFDLVLGSSFFKELEEIVRSQISIDELGYEDEDGSVIPGESVLEDVILQGARVNRERMEHERSRQESLLDDEPPDEDGDGEEEYETVVAYVPYDPWGPAAAYMGSALFVEALWLSAYW